MVLAQHRPFVKPNRNSNRSSKGNGNDDDDDDDDDDISRLPPWCWETGRGEREQLDPSVSSTLHSDAQHLAQRQKEQEALHHGAGPLPST